MEVFGSKSSQKVAAKFACEKCNYVTCKKGNFMKHITTDKHALSHNGSIGSISGYKKEPEHYQCDNCKKVFKTHGGMWKHKQRCMVSVLSATADQTPLHTSSAHAPVERDTISLLLKQNQEFKDLILAQNSQILEMSKNMGNNTNITHTNSHNKTFNLQFFLNETCKDAMNITDFLKSLHLKMTDLERVGELGYAEGISRMFVQGLNELEVTKRPIHCSDLKREIIHIKDKDRWERDNASQDILKSAIKEISNKNIMLLDDWLRENPGCTEYDHRKNDMYLRMQCESMGPIDKSAEKKDFGKIIRSIAKNTIINKELYIN